MRSRICDNSIGFSFVFLYKINIFKTGICIKFNSFESYFHNNDRNARIGFYDHSIKRILKLISYIELKQRIRFPRLKTAIYEINFIEMFVTLSGYSRGPEEVRGGIVNGTNLS